MSEELSKQNIVIAKGVNTLNKILSKWAPPKINNANRFGKGSTSSKTVKSADQKVNHAKPVKNDAIKDNATKALSNITLQT